MPPQPQEVTWLVDPDKISVSIKLLAATVAAFASGMGGLLLYIDKTRMKWVKGTFSTFEDKMDGISEGLTAIADKMQETALGYEHRITEIETSQRNLKDMCSERHGFGRRHYDPKGLEE